MAKMKHLLLTTIAAVVLVGCGKSSIHDAAYDGNIEAVKQHLADGADVNGKDDGWTPLHFAAYWGHKEIVELLLAKAPRAKGDPIGWVDGNNGTRHYIYKGSRGHVHELSLDDGKWMHRNLSASGG